MSPGVARTFFSFYVIIITSTLRFRLRYVTVAGVKRIAARVYASRLAFKTLAVTSQVPRVYEPWVHELVR